MKTFALFSSLAAFLFAAAVSAKAENLNEVLDSVLTTPPPLLTKPAPRYDDENRDFNMNCGIAKTPGGRLWACWISGGDSPDAYLVAAISDDDGKTWSKPILVIDPPDTAIVKRRVLIANFWTDPRGRLWLFFDYGVGFFDGRIGVWSACCENPDDAEPKWSEPVRIADGSFHNKILLLKDGTWLMPAELYARKYSDWSFKKIGKDYQGFPELDDGRGITFWASNDEGKTWKRRGRAVFPVSAGEEPVCLEKNDGSLWCLARTPAGMHQSFSSDRGETWSRPVPAFPHPVARFFVTRLNSGNLLFVRHGTFAGEEKSRARLTAWISEDDGANWKGGLMLDERSGVSYPDGIQDKDGTIYVTYDRDRGNAAEILLAVFTEDDARAGKPVSSVCRLKQRVNKAGTKP